MTRLPNPMWSRGERKQRHPDIRPNLVFGHGGWVFDLPDDLEPSDSIRLQLWEHAGVVWKSYPFAPHQTETKMVQSNEAAMVTDVG